MEVGDRVMVEYSDGDYPGTIREVHKDYAIVDIIYNDMGDIATDEVENNFIKKMKFLKW